MLGAVLWARIDLSTHTSLLLDGRGELGEGADCNQTRVLSSQHEVSSGGGWYLRQEGESVGSFRR